ncbi:MAG: carboxypeptidase-like regulatory domain-containing protein, partial [Marinirhabdus sp.]
MKTLQNIRPLACLMIICAIAFSAPQVSAQELTDYTEFKGKVVDAATDRGLTSASIVVEGSNIGTITNDEGEFLLKVPAKDANGTLLVSILGYTVNKVAIANLLSEGNLIKLSPKITELTEVNVSTYTDPEKLVRQVFKRKVENNGDTDLKMTAFYRETIKKRNRNVSLTEAVVNLHKKPYASTERDVIELHKARKSTDYKRMDTVALKLQGGPFSTLYLDIMKYPEYIFTEASIPNYIFTFDSPTAINGKPVYVVHFID